MEWLIAISALAVVGGLVASSVNNSNAIESQEEENQLQREYATEEWNRQFAATNEYNDPTNVNSRLTAAGINPAVYWDNGTTSARSNSSPSLAPSSGGLNIPNLGMSDAIAGLVSSPEKVANTLNKLYEAKAQKTANEFQRQQIQATIDNIISDTNNKDIDTALSKFEQEMNQQYGRALKHNEVQLALQNYKLAYAETFLKIKQGEKVDLEKLTEESERLLKDSARYLNDTQRQLMGVDLRYRAQMLQSQINQNNASAALSNAQATTENVLRPLRSTAQSLLNDINENQRNFDSATFNARFEKMMNELSYQNLQMISRELENRDKQAYTTFQRLLYGKGTADDRKRFLQYIVSGDPIELYNSAQ